MIFRLVDLNITFKKQTELINFSDVNYFYGKMGAGKSTIARLIDYCLGGNLGETEMTPALQREFVSADLTVTINERTLTLVRETNSDQLRARWCQGNDYYEVLIPARKSKGEVLPDTGVEVLSDLIFFLAGKTPPKVRRSKIKEESELERLSVRDLLWYCYLDQDSMDSSFFHLGQDDDTWKRLKSRDVLRFLVGFHQEEVAALEVRLEQLRTERIKCEAGIAALKEALNSSAFGSVSDLKVIKENLAGELEKANQEIDQARKISEKLRPHGMEVLQQKAKLLAVQLAELSRSADEIRELNNKYKIHRNELYSLSTKFHRSLSARSVLGGVNFKNCPKCGKDLPARLESVCSICGQTHSEACSSDYGQDIVEKDLGSRIAELEDLIKSYDDQMSKIQMLVDDTKRTKEMVDSELNIVATTYDSAYLSGALEAEKRRASIQQAMLDLARFDFMVKSISQLTTKLMELRNQEDAVRVELKEARVKAEGDTNNIQRLKTLFLDCLLRSKIPGFFHNDVVEMKSPWFLPEIYPADDGLLAVTSFSNLGSGGKKTLFKCCFALAVHRLAAEVNALLPSILIIDSPMKNISERENVDQFEGFFNLVYELCGSELKETQFIFIDKEVCRPKSNQTFTFTERHMMPNEPGCDPTTNPAPPLIRYYVGK